jgi:Mn2+/Fe2+ NRAMP family transporter
MSRTNNTASKRKPRDIVFRLLGLGLVTGAADDDPSGIATYSQAGAQFGYGLLWTVFLTTPFMIAIQLVSAHIGRVTGKGIAANAKQFYPLPLVLVPVLLLVIANTINIAADLAAMGEALYLVIGGLKHEHALIFAAVSVRWQAWPSSLTILATLSSTSASESALLPLALRLSPAKRIEVRMGR